jgi:uncharacterized membrane protein YphA (DoxX/SURF4 family)
VDLVALIGRILFSLLFLGSAFGGHFGATDATAGYAESRGLKGARMLVLLTGAQLAAGGLMVLLGIWADLGALLIAAFTLAAAFLIHHFWTDQDPMVRQMEMTQFMKDIALTGAALLVFVLYAVFGDELGFQIVDPLFDLSL